MRDRIPHPSPRSVLPATSGLYVDARSNGPTVTSMPWLST